MPAMAVYQADEELALISSGEETSQTQRFSRRGAIALVIGAVACTGLVALGRSHGNEVSSDLTVLDEVSDEASYTKMEETNVHGGDVSIGGLPQCAHTDPANSKCGTEPGDLSKPACIKACDELPECVGFTISKWGGSLKVADDGVCLVKDPVVTYYKKEAIDFANSTDEAAFDDVEDDDSLNEANSTTTDVPSPAPAPGPQFWPWR